MKILVDVERGEKIVQLKTNIGQLGEQILKTNTAMKAQGHTMAEIAAQLSPLNNQLATMTHEFQQLEAASGKGGYGLMQLGYAIDDLQYGFSSIVNNIPQIAQSIGGEHAMAIAGAAGIAAVAVNQLMKHWGDLSDFIESNWSSKSIEQLKDIRQKAEDAKAALDKIPPFNKREEKQASGMEAFVQNAPKEQLINDVMGAIQANPDLREEMSLAHKRQLAHEQARIVGTKGGEEQRQQNIVDIQAAAAKDMLGRAREKAQKIVGESLLPGEAGEEGRATLKTLLPGRRGEFEAISPESQKRAEDDQKREERMKREFQTDQANRNEQEKMFAVERDAKDKAQKDAEHIGDLDRKNAKEMGDIKKKDEETIRKKILDRIQGEKTARIRGLEDQRTAIMNKQRDFDEKMWEKTHEQASGRVLTGGPRALLDLYQANAGGNDDRKMLAKQAHDQRVKTNAELERIRTALEKEQRFGPKH